MLIAYESSLVTLSSGAVIIHLYKSRIKNCKRKCPRNKLSNSKECGGQGRRFYPWQNSDIEVIASYWLTLICPCVGYVCRPRYQLHNLRLTSSSLAFVSTVQ